MTELALVVLAAGLGSRFGGTKQLAEVGPSGEAILDYTIDDARRAGFDEIVLIVRRDLEQLVTEHLRATHGPALTFRLVFQDDFGPSRAKPWGTGHAVLAARDTVDGPFAVVNADDFYGTAAFGRLAEALRNDDDPADRHYLVAYRLARTLSASGTVSRGVCSTGADGMLTSIVENLAIERVDGRIVSHDSGAELAEDTPVSMNLWGLRPSIFTELGTAWERFLAERGDDPKAEFQLPTVISAAVHAGRASVAVARTDADWMGVTYPADLADVVTRIGELVASGAYRSPLTTGSA
ncbi:MAG: NTP transferase domain-containing protein [Acidimicrobiales bacterium]